jgi:hypothetical protein
MIKYNLKVNNNNDLKNEGSSFELRTDGDDLNVPLATPNPSASRKDPSKSMRHDPQSASSSSCLRLAPSHASRALLRIEMWLLLNPENPHP